MLAIAVRAWVFRLQSSSSRNWRTAAAFVMVLLSSTRSSAWPTTNPVCSASLAGATSDSTVTLIPDTLESTSLELCAPPGGLTVFSEAALHPSCSSTSVGFEVAGSVSANGASTLTMSVGSEPWVPLPNLLSNFMMPVLTGEPPHQNISPDPFATALTHASNGPTPHLLASSHPTLVPPRAPLSCHRC